MCTSFRVQAVLTVAEIREHLTSRFNDVLIEEDELFDGRSVLEVTMLRPILDRYLQIQWCPSDNYDGTPGESVVVETVDGGGYIDDEVLWDNTWIAQLDRHVDWLFGREDKTDA